MTAIQEVLSASDEPPNARASPIRSRPVRRARPPAAPAQRARRRRRTCSKAPGPRSRRRCGRPVAANDDRQSIGQILQTLQRRRPGCSYLVATVFALAWVAGGVTLAFLYLPDLQCGADAGPAARFRP